MRFVHFVQDLVILTFLMVFAVLSYTAVNPPAMADQQHCGEVYNDGLDYAFCVIDKTI